MNIGIAGSDLGGISNGFGEQFNGAGKENDGTSSNGSQGNGATANSDSSWSSWASGYSPTSGYSGQQSSTGPINNADWSGIQNDFLGAGSTVNTYPAISSGNANGVWSSNSQVSGGSQQNSGHGFGADGSNQNGGGNAQSTSNFLAPQLDGKQSVTSGIGSDDSVITGGSNGMDGLSYNSGGGSYNSAGKSYSSGGGFNGPSTTFDPSGTNSYSYTWSS